MKTVESHYEKTSGTEKLLAYALIAVSVIMLVWTECATRGLTRASAEMSEIFVELDDTTEALPENDGKMVYFRAFEQTDESIADPIYGVGGHYLGIARVVEYYQWVETSKTKWEKINNKEEKRTEYSYEAKWTDKPINSLMYNDISYENKAPLLVDAGTMAVKNIKMGAYTLDPDIRKFATGSYNTTLEHGVDMATASKVLANASEQMPVHLLDKEIYYGKDPAHPAIGDVRVSFKATIPGLMYVLAKANKDTLVPYFVWEISEKKFELDSTPIDTKRFLEYDTEGAGYLMLTLRIIAWLLVVWAVHELRGSIVYPLRKKRFISRIIPQADNKLALWAVGTYMSIAIIICCHFIACITA